MPTPSRSGFWGATPRIRGRIATSRAGHPQWKCPAFASQGGGPATPWMWGSVPRPRTLAAKSG
eukprot:3072478-Pyramimonas_sp.AAC.1